MKILLMSIMSNKSARRIKLPAILLSHAVFLTRVNRKRTLRH